MSRRQLDIRRSIDFPRRPGIRERPARKVPEIPTYDHPSEVAAHWPPTPTPKPARLHISPTPPGVLSGGFYRSASEWTVSTVLFSALYQFSLLTLLQIATRICALSVP